MESKHRSIGTIEKVIESEFDFNFSINEKRIDTPEQFDAYLMQPFIDKGKRLFYRGERINTASRRLIPTMLRNVDGIFKNGEPAVNIDYDFLLDYYRSKGAYLDFYRYIFGKASKYRMFEICSFSQHYLDESPFIDFTKSLYVALSFALKGRERFDDDIVVYAVGINDDENYTQDIVTAECWLHDYKVTVVDSPERIVRRSIENMKPFKSRELLEIANERAKSTSPTAKFIDIPTNDLIKFQQGVLLLLTDFTLFYNSYLTKAIRENFSINKFVVSRNICPYLVNVINENAPWYSYDCILDIKDAVGKVINIDNFNPLMD